jgi:hypothetical protein
MRAIKRAKRAVLLLTPPLVINYLNDLRAKPERYTKSNAEARKNFKHNFEVLEFSLISADSPFDLKWGWWSRVYEYDLAIEKMKKLGLKDSSKIHNTCWGYHGSHILFKNELEKLSKNVTNSDLITSDIPNTTTYDLRNHMPSNWVEEFDFVVNISTIEEIPFSHVRIVENLLTMVKPNGYLIATFDIPGIQLDEISKLLNRPIEDVVNPLRGDNSPYQMNEFSNLRVGYLVLKKL